MDEIVGTPAVDWKSLSVESIAPHDRKAARRAARRYGLPHLPEFLSDINARQSGEDEARGRRYQREAVYRGCLEIISPFTGRALASNRSFILERRKIAYLFNEPCEFYVIAARIVRGYPLAALLVPESECLLDWEPKSKIKRRTIESINAAAALQANSRDEYQRGRPTVVLGHQNFAHQMWNELSALERLVAEREWLHRTDLFVLCEPLGALESIFPELSGCSIERLKDQALPETNASGRFFVNVAGYRVTNTLRSRIVAHANASAEARTRPLQERIRSLDAPVFWLSVRIRDYTFENQRDVLAAISVRLLDSFPRCCLLFDGFSLPEDWQRRPGNQIESMLLRSRSEFAEVDAIIEDISKRTRNLDGDHLLVNAAGLRLLDSIALAQLAHAYFCHAGTVQHKIAWNTTCRGIIHAAPVYGTTVPSGGHFLHRAQRDAARVEDGVPPAVIEERLLHRVGRNSSNYEAVDCESIAGFVVDYFASCVAPHSSAGAPAQRISKAMRQKN